MRTTFSRLPWRELPPVFAEILRPRIEEIGSAMVQAIRREVPAYHRPLDSPTGRDLVTSVHRAMHQFAELTEDPDGSQRHYEHFFQRLGRREFLNGRTTDGLQAACRVGARVACRRYVELARAASLPTEVELPLNEAVLTHINALSDQAVHGFTSARTRSAGQLQRSRATLAARLLEQTPAPLGEPAGVLAERAGWPLPATVAAVVLRPAAHRDQLLAALDEDILVLPRGDSLHLAVPEPDSGGRAARLRSAVRGLPGALGPAVPPEDAWLSLHCARLALGRRRAPGGAGGPDELIDAAAHLLEVHLVNGAHIGRLMAERTLAPLRELPAGKAARLAETLDALLTSWGRTAPEVADALRIHPQTARNRLRRLDELFGDRLADPSFRIEALVALRTRAMRPPGPAE